ncbi:MAG: ComEC/Rec2 family competence protein [Solirubrobacteraceae bacterium]
MIAEVRRHPRHLVLFALVAGLLCGGWAPPAAAPVALAGMCLAGGRGLAVLAVVAVLGGALVAEARRTALATGALPAPLGESVRVRATLLEPLHERASGELVARVDVGGEPLLLKVRDRSLLSAASSPGDVLAVAGRVEDLDDYDAIQRRRGALAALEAEDVDAIGARRGGLLGTLDGVRRRAEAGLGEGVPQSEGALLAGMVLGRDDLIDTDTEEAFRASGLAHLLAVSGTNVLLLATLVLAAGALLGLPLRTRLAAALVLVALYVPLTGAGPSIQRAGVMGAAGLVAALAGRPSSRAYALGLAAAVTLTLNPSAAADAGWQLSFAAVVGLMVLARPLREHLVGRRVPAPLAEATAMTLAATVATAPLLAVHFSQVSLVSLPANLMAAPVIAPIMWLGMLASAAAQVDTALAAPFTALAAPLVGFVDLIAARAAALPHAVVAVELPGVLGAVVGYAALTAAWFAHRRVARGPRRAGLAAAVVILGVLAVTPAQGFPRPAPGETVVSFLDIGQGDATLIERDGQSVLFDTGPAGGPIVSRLREVGVERLDALVITHAQDDHEGAALPVVAGFRPRLIVDGGAGWPTPVQRALPAAAAAAGSRVMTAAAGDELRIGPLRLDVRWPSEAVAQLPPIGDPNGRAMVVHLRSGGFDLLLAADAETAVTGALDLDPVEALKVAHHGSDDPGLPAQLEQLRPLFAAIEVGDPNRYGHPTPATLAALEAVPHVYRTDRDGTVQLRVTATGMRVLTRPHD